MITDLQPQLIGNLRREFLIWKSYGFNAISSLLMWAIIFPLLVAIMQNVASRNEAIFGPDELLASLVGFLAWKMGATIITEIPSSIEFEARTGTLENVFLSSSVSISQQIIIRALTRSVFALAETLILAISMSLLFRLVIPVTPTFLLILLLILFGMWGIGFMAAGLTLIFKAGVVTIMTLLANLALLISLIPVYTSGPLFAILKAIFPLTWGIDLLRQEAQNQAGIQYFVNNGEIFWFLLQTAVFFIGGLLIFHLCFGRAKMQGELGTY